MCGIWQDLNPTMVSTARLNYDTDIESSGGGSHVTQMKYSHRDNRFQVWLPNTPRNRVSQWAEQ